MRRRDWLSSLLRRYRYGSKGSRFVHGSTLSFFTSIHTTEKHIELIRDPSKTTR